MYSPKKKFGKIKERFTMKHHHVLPVCHLDLTDVIPRQCLDTYARVSRMGIQAQPWYGSFEDVYWTKAEAKPKLLSNKRTRIYLVPVRQGGLSDNRPRTGYQEIPSSVDGCISNNPPCRTKEIEVGGVYIAINCGPKLVIRS